MIRIFAILFCTFSAFAQLAHAAEEASSEWWKTFSPDSKTKILEIYNKCHAAVGPGNDGKTVCRGIFGPDCVKDSYCDYIFRVTETEDAFEFEGFNLESYGQDQMPNKDLGYMIGFAPFEKVGNNYTAKCKSGITLKDFKFFVYKLNLERRSYSAADTERVSWDATEIYGRDTAGEPISKKKFTKSCELRLEERIRLIDQYRGGPITHPSNAVMKIDGEFMLIAQARYFDSYKDDEKLPTRDGSRYTSSDGVLYTNFANLDLPKDKRAFQVPQSEFSPSSASHLIIVPSFLTAILAYFVQFVSVRI